MAQVTTGQSAHLQLLIPFQSSEISPGRTDWSSYELKLRGDEVVLWLPGRGKIREVFPRLILGCSETHTESSNFTVFV